MKVGLLRGPTEPRVSVRRRTYRDRIYRMKIAAYQAPLLENGSMEALSYLRAQVDVCEDKGVEILCCPEAVLGGLADYSDRPAELAFNVENGQLEEFLSPLTSETVSTIIGFTESANTGLYNTAIILHRGKVFGRYRKAYPAIRNSIYNAGDELPTFAIGPLTFGIIICNDTNYIEPSRVMAAKGATVLFVPTNNCLPLDKADVVARARSTQTARAVENGLTVIAADVAGRQDGFASYGSTNIIDPNGVVLASSKPLVEDLLIADIEPEADQERRGWDSSKNPAIVRAFLEKCYPESNL